MNDKYYRGWVPSGTQCKDCKRRPIPYVAHERRPKAVDWMCVKHVADKLMPQAKVQLATIQARDITKIKLPSKIGK